MSSTPADFDGRLKAESLRYMALLERLGAKLTGSLAADCNDVGTPSRDWARSFGHYSGGVRGLLGEQRERAKLKLLAGKAGQQPLSDEEYEAELRQLAIETVRELPESELQAELARRGVTPGDLAVRDEPD
jgi:hypothetical protein